VNSNDITVKVEPWKEEPPPTGTFHGGERTSVSDVD
jgi:hypothetical protein